MINGACAVTWLRILLTPVVIWCMVQDLWMIALCVFLCAAVTDLLDGFIARRFGQQTKFGQILDPIADKILFGCTMLVMLAVVANPLMHGVLYFLIVKEIILLVGGGILWFGYKKFIPPSILSRLVSLCEVVLLLAIFAWQIVGVVHENFVYTLLVINVALSMVLLLQYLKKILKIIHANIA